jgi:hypothetical protein
MGRSADVHSTRFNDRSPACHTTGLDRDLLRAPIRLVQAEVVALTVTVKGHLAVIRLRGNSDADLYDLALRRLPGAGKTISRRSRPRASPRGRTDGPLTPLLTPSPCGRG